jgi:hypothetical protein
VKRLQRTAQLLALGALSLVCVDASCASLADACAALYAKLPEVARKASGGVRGYLRSYGTDQVGPKRLFLKPDQEHLQTRGLGLVTVHDSAETLDFHEKLFRVKKGGKYYTLRPIQGIFKRYVSPFTREGARTGAQFVPTVPSYILLGALGANAATDYLFKKAEDTARDYGETLSAEKVAKYRADSFFLKDFRAQGLDMSNPEAKVKMEKIVAEVRQGRSIDFARLNDGVLTGLAAKLKAFVPEQENLDVHSMLTLATFLASEQGGLDGLSADEKLALDAMTFASGMETFKSKLMVLGDSFGADEESGFRYRGQNDEAPKPLNMLDPKGLRVLMNAASSHFEQLAIARQVDPHAKEPTPARETDAYRQLSEANPAFREWIATKNPSDASVAYYLSAHAEKQRFYALYEALGVQPQIQKNGQWVDLKMASYEAAFPQWAEALK